MSNRSESKIREGLQHIAAAEKCLKTSLFKWSADWEGAASEYSKAGNCFKNAKSYEQASNAFRKAGDAQLKSQVYRSLTQNLSCYALEISENSLYHAAKSYEQAALMLKELNRIDEAVDLLRQASSMLSEHGSPASAAQALIRAARICEASKIETAIDLYLRACSLHQIEDKTSEAVECVGKAARLQLKLKKYPDALKTLQEQRNLYHSLEKYPSAFRIIVAMILVHLKLGDEVAADKCFRDSTEYPGFASSEEGALLEDLLNSIRDGDSDVFQRCIRSPIILHNDNEVAKLARDLRPPTVAVQDSNPSGGSNALEPGDDEDDDMGDALN